MSAADHPYLAVLNPAAGGGRCGKRAPDILARLRQAGLPVEVMETSGPGEAGAIVRKAWAEGRRHFLAMGGDGTAYEMVNGLFPEALSGGEGPSLGFLPLGTGNSFLRDFTTEGIEYSLQAILEGRSRACDVIQLECAEETLYYINILSIGFTANVGSLTNRRFKALGESGYKLATVVEVARLKSQVFPMKIDGGALDQTPCTFVSINNSRYTGGKMMMAPHAEVSDGKAALVRVGEMGRVSLLQTFPKIFKGTHVQHPVVETSKVEQIDFELQEAIDIMIDGEVLRRTPRALRVLPSALKVQV